MDNAKVPIRLFLINSDPTSVIFFDGRDDFSRMIFRLVFLFHREYSVASVSVRFSKYFTMLLFLSSCNNSVRYLTAWFGLLLFLGTLVIIHVLLSGIFFFAYDYLISWESFWWVGKVGEVKIVDSQAADCIVRVNVSTATLMSSGVFSKERLQFFFYKWFDWWDLLVLVYILWSNLGMVRK